MQCPTFLQSLLTMEAATEYADYLRSLVAAGNSEYQRVLIEVEKLEDDLTTGTIVITPAPEPPHLREAITAFINKIRSRIENGETVLQETLDEVHVVMRHLDAGKIRIEPVPISAAA